MTSSDNSVDGPCWGQQHAGSAASKVSIPVWTMANVMDGSDCFGFLLAMSQPCSTLFGVMSMMTLDAQVS
jgi:hypothetical protein